MDKNNASIDLVNNISLKGSRIENSTCFDAWHFGKNVDYSFSSTETNSYRPTSFEMGDSASKIEK